MFERFTDRARRVVVLAQEEARLLWHGWIGPEHVLLGLLHEGEGIGSMALGSQGATVQRARQMVEELLPRGDIAPSGHIPFTDEAKRCLEKSLRQAFSIGHNYIGTEHLLLGLIAEGCENTEKMLVDMCGSSADVREAVIDLLRSFAPQPSQPEVAKSLPAPMMKVLDELDAMAPRQRKAVIAFLRSWYPEGDL